LGVARDVRPQYFGTRHSSAFVSVALAAFTRFTGQRQLSHGAIEDSRPVAACRALEKLTFTKIALVVHK
jgi:hypothetical protein